MNIPPTAPAQGLIPLLATVTTPPPSGKRVLTSAYFNVSSRKTIIVSVTKSPAAAPTCPYRMPGT